jgi:hypothetical protein
MKCKECIAVIDEFFEGDLDERAAGEITAHIASCADCANAFAELQREQEIYSHYLLNIEATPAVWSGVSAGIAKEKSVLSIGFLPSFGRRLAGAFTRFRFNPLLAAATIVMMLGITFVLVQFLDSRPFGPTQDFARQDTKAGERQPVNNSGTTANTASNPIEFSYGSQRTRAGDRQQSLQRPAFLKRAGRRYSASPARLDRDVVARSNPEGPEQNPAAEQIVIAAEKEYLRAIAVLTRELESRRPQLSQQKLATLEQALSVIDQTIADTRFAARQHAKDSLTVHYMLSAYTDKIDLLREATL